MANEHLRNLLLARSAAAADLATWALMLANPQPRGDGSDAAMPFELLRDLVLQLEAQTCALLQYCGLSWDALATETVRTSSRQALHRRLASLADEQWISAERNKTDNKHELQSNIEIALAMSRQLSDRAIQDLESAPEKWEKYRRTPHWWRSED